jgi:hypothetical protein
MQGQRRRGGGGGGRRRLARAGAARGLPAAARAKWVGSVREGETGESKCLLGVVREGLLGGGGL